MTRWSICYNVLSRMAFICIFRRSLFWTFSNIKSNYKKNHERFLSFQTKYFTVNLMKYVCNLRMTSRLASLRLQFSSKPQRSAFKRSEGVSTTVSNSARVASSLWHHKFKLFEYVLQWLFVHINKNNIHIQAFVLQSSHSDILCAILQHCIYE